MYLWHPIKVGEGFIEITQRLNYTRRAPALCGFNDPGDLLGFFERHSSLSFTGLSQDLSIGVRRWRVGSGNRMWRGFGEGHSTPLAARSSGEFPVSGLSWICIHATHMRFARVSGQDIGCLVPSC
jgi:hypothetical protein